MKSIVAVSATSFAKNRDLVDEARQRFPQVEFRFCNPSEELTLSTLPAFLEGAAGWIIGKEPMNEELLKSLDQLKVIAKYGVGLDNIDFELCKDLQIPVYFEAGVNSAEVAELTIGLMISHARNIALVSRKLGQGKWWKNGGYNFTGKKVGIVGFGHIGSKVAALAKAFQCQVYVNDILDFEDFCRKKGYIWSSFEEMVSQVDFLSFHVPLTDLTRQMLDGELLTRLSNQTVVVNTSRGEVLNQSALTKMLEQKRLGGLALDVYETEPLTDKSLYEQEKFLGTAHIAGNSREAVWKMGTAALNGIGKFLLDR